MKYLTLILTLLLSVATFAQNDIPVIADGTAKYYILVYDGVNNDKILFNNNPYAGWQTDIQITDFFDGSNNQLWSFKATEMYPGYVSIFNYDENLTEAHFLMSWNWLAYMGSNRDPSNSPEMQYRFVEVTDGWYKIETIEKEAGLNGIEYTPGADALSLVDGLASFSELKSADITLENMAYKAFRFVEFDPLKLFEETVFRADELYNANSNAPEQVLYDLFYITEKARELIVFGEESEVLAFQPTLDTAIINFSLAINLVDVIDDAREFIDTIGADQDVTDSFNDIVDEIEVYLGSDDADYSVIDSVTLVIKDAQSLVVAIVDAQTYGESLTSDTLINGLNMAIDKAKSILASDTSVSEDYLAAITLLEETQGLIDAILAAQAFGESLVDDTLISGLNVSLDTAKLILITDTSTLNDFLFAASHLAVSQDIITEIITATELIANTQEFDEAKAELNLAIDEAIGIINTHGNTLEDLDLALDNIQTAISVFQKALEAGDTPLVLINADFESDLADWNVESPTPAAAYAENKGVDGSRSITFWRGSDYQMKVYQSINNIPNGTYRISCFAKVNVDSTIGMFATSGDSTVILPIAGNVLAQHELQIPVTNGALEFGIKGVGVDNAIPAGNWIVFDEFEVKWSSNVEIVNPGFETGDFTGWFKEASAGWNPYIEQKGVDGSNSVTFWQGADYRGILSQTVSGLRNGKYTVSAMTNSSNDSSFVIFGESGGQTFTEPILQGGLAKHKIIAEVTDGTLIFGIKGSGENDSVPAGNWIVIDNFEINRLPDVTVINPDFELDLAGWFYESTVGWMPYIENKGVDGSKSVTFWQGADYWVYTYQQLTGLLSGAYEISAMTNTPNDGSFVLYGASEQEFRQVISLSTGLEKNKVLATVTSGGLEIGVKGAGADSSAPAGHWIVFDNFEVLIKSIIPDYVIVPPPPMQGPLSNVDAPAKENEVVCWQNYEYLNIRSTEVIIVKYSVYSIAGAMVTQQEVRNNHLLVPIDTGIYIVRVETNDGEVHNKKVIIQ